MFIGLGHAPDDDHGVERATSHHAAVRTPSNAVDAGVVEAPLHAVELLISWEAVHNHLVKESSINHNLDFKYTLSILHDIQLK